MSSSSSQATRDKIGRKGSFLFGLNFGRTLTPEERDQKRLEKALRRESSKHQQRGFKSGMILGTAWIASSYWTFLGFVQTAEETATASFQGTLQALIASVVAAVVVAGCCGLLLGFSGSGGTNE